MSGLKKIKKKQERKEKVISSFSNGRLYQAERKARSGEKSERWMEKTNHELKSHLNVNFWMLYICINIILT